MPGLTTQTAHVTGYGATAGPALPASRPVTYTPLDPIQTTWSKQFATHDDMKQAVTSWLETLDTDFFYAGIQALVSQWDKSLKVSCDYVEV